MGAAEIQMILLIFAGKAEGYIAELCGFFTPRNPNKGTGTFSQDEQRERATPGNAKKLFLNSFSALTSRTFDPFQDEFWQNFYLLAGFMLGPCFAL